MWLSIDTQCMIFFETEYWDLTLLFKINVVLLSITFLVLCCMLCLMGAVSLSLSPRTHTHTRTRKARAWQRGAREEPQQTLVCVRACVCVCVCTRTCLSMA